MINNISAIEQTQFTKRPFSDEMAVFISGVVDPFERSGPHTGGSPQNVNYWATFGVTAGSLARSTAITKIRA
jgi:hypothetical protein